MPLKAKIVFVNIGVIVVALLLFAFGRSLSERVDELQRVWNDHSVTIQAKTNTLYKIHSHFGYGGFIHHFKNLVLRRDGRYISLAQASLTETLRAIKAYESLPLTDAEQQALQAFRQVVARYAEQFEQVRQLFSHLDPRSLDAEVRVDDTEAFVALTVMAEGIAESRAQVADLGQSQLRDSFQAIRMQYALLGLLVVSVGGIGAWFLVRLARSLNQIQALFAASPDALIESDLQGRITRVNRRAEEIFGFSSEEFCRLQVEDLIPKEMRGHHRRQREGYQQSTRVTAMGDRSLSLVGLRKGGEVFPAEIAISTFRSGNVRACVSIVRDITARQQLEVRSQTDFLTGLANRYRCDSALRDELARAKRYGQPLSLILCDIDHFKAINDQYGHPVGDQALVTLARYLGYRVRTTDTVGRWGGEEFLIICPGTDQAGAKRLAAEVKEGLEEAQDRMDVGFTLSFGVTQFDSLDDSQASLIQRVDEALYAAKREGRNCIRLR